MTKALFIRTSYFVITMMLDYIERKLALPGDDELLRKRKVAAFFAGLFGAIVALLFVALYFSVGDPLPAWLYATTVA